MVGESVQEKGVDGTIAAGGWWVVKLNLLFHWDWHRGVRMFEIQLWLSKCEKVWETVDIVEFENAKEEKFEKLWSRWSSIKPTSIPLICSSTSTASANRSAKKPTPNPTDTNSTSHSKATKKISISSQAHSTINNAHFIYISKRNPLLCGRLTFDKAI